MTIYILTSVFPIEIPLVYSSGQLWITLLGYVFVFSGAIMLAMGWKIFHSAESELVTDGVYRLVRHPYYTGIFFAISGQLVHWPTIPTLLLSPLIIWAYVHLAMREEMHLTQQFGASYLAYQRVVPMFLPTRQGILRYVSSSRGEPLSHQ